MAAATVSAYPAENRVEPGSINVEPGNYPRTIESSSVDCLSVATKIVDDFNKALQAKDYEALTKLFATEGYWRDHLCTSWDLHTYKGQARIRDALNSSTSLKSLKVETTGGAHRQPQLTPIDVPGQVQIVMFFISLTTETGHGEGVVRLTQEGGEWKIWALFTTLRGLKDFPAARGHHRPAGVEHGQVRDVTNWQDKRHQSINETDPAVLVIGAGQGGLSAAAHLGLLNVPTLIVDRNERVGDNWRQRYRQLVLHDPVWFNHLPYLSFPAHWPIFTPKDKMAEFLEAYVMLLELNVWTRTTIKSTTWDESTKRWTVELERSNLASGQKELRVVHPRHIIQSTGHSGKKNLPVINGADSFKGRICHSSEFPGAKPGSKGKRAVVVGSCNSGHDIAQDLYDNGYNVTIVQRSSTCVVSSESITEIGLKGLYDETGPPTDDADLILWSIPMEMHKRMQIEVTKLMNEKDKATLEGLQRVGFKVDMGPHCAGLIMKYFQRGGGYYIDIGASQLIIDGKIGIKQGQEITAIEADGLVFADGSKLAADEIIFATGYRNMRTQAREVFGDEVADAVKDVWGVTDEGEFRTMWQRTGHPGLWFMGGNLALTRYYSRILALQIKAAEEGLVGR